MMRRSTTAALLAAAMFVLVLPGAGWATHGFGDVTADNVFHDDIAWLAENGVTKGCSPSEYCPDDTLTRAQMAAFLRRVATNGAVDAGSLGGLTLEEVLDAAATDTPGPLALDMADVNLATAGYQDVMAAEMDGYAEFLECFDNPGVGGMGQHYANGALIDDRLEPNRPEALVYEIVAPDQLVLVGVEYVVPQDVWTDPEPPELFGQTFHKNDDLGIWALHAWIWKDNPTGMFETWNPKVRMCPKA